MRKVLLVVDFQKDFVDGALGFPGAEALEVPLCRRIERARQEGWAVWFTLDTHHADYLRTQEGRPPAHAPLHRGHAGLGPLRPGCGPAPGGGRLLLQGRARQPRAPAVPDGPPGGGDRAVRPGLQHVRALQRRGLQGGPARVPRRRQRGADRSFDPALHAKAMDVLRGVQIDVLGGGDADAH